MKYVSRESHILMIAGACLMFPACLSIRIPVTGVALSSAPVTQLAFISIPAATSGTALTGGPLVELRDASGTRVGYGADASLAVTITLASGTGFMVGDSATVNAVQGLADFSSAGLRFEKGGPKTLSVSATSSAGPLSAASSSFQVAVNATSQFALLSGVLNPAGHADGTGSGAKLSAPGSVASDGTYYYFPDQGSHTIRRMSIATHAIDTIAGQAWSPGEIDGTGSAARFDTPFGIAYNGGFLYVTDRIGATLRKIDLSNNSVTTIAGIPYSWGYTEGSPGASRLSFPQGVAYLGGNLYIADSNNCRVRTVNATTGATSTLVGNGTCANAYGAFASTTVNFPNDITTDGTNLYIAAASDVAKLTMGTTTSSLVFTGGGTIRAVYYNANRIYFSIYGDVSYYDLVGLAYNPLSGRTWTIGYVDGASGTALFQSPLGMIVEGANLLVMDNGNSVIRNVVLATGTASTLAGGAGGGVGQVLGSASASRYNNVNDAVSDGTNLYVVDSGNQVIRAVDSSGTSSILAGTFGALGNVDGAGASAKFDNPTHLTTDGKALYVVNTDGQTIRKITLPGGVVSTIAGTYGATGSTDATGAAARFDYPAGITTDGKYLYVVDNGTIRKIDLSSYAVTRLAGSPGVLACTDGTSTTARFSHSSATGIAYLDGYLYVADTWCRGIRKVNASTGDTVTLAGGPGNNGSADGTGTSAYFSDPNGTSGMQGITTDGIYLYVDDAGNSTIRRVDPTTGQVVTVFSYAVHEEDLTGPSASASVNNALGTYFGFGTQYMTTDRGVFSLY